MVVVFWGKMFQVLVLAAFGALPARVSFHPALFRLFVFLRTYWHGRVWRLVHIQTRWANSTPIVSVKTTADAAPDLTLAGGHYMPVRHSAEALYYSEGVRSDPECYGFHSYMCR